MDITPKRDTINGVTKKSYKCLHDKTIKKADRIKELGYNLVSIWECEYTKQKQSP